MQAIIPVFNSRHMTKTLIDTYQSRVVRGEIEPDEMQAQAVEQFAALAERLSRWRGGRRRAFGWFRAKREPAPRGIYLYGSVGRGKSMLMDLFFEHVAIKPKRRVHFHEFMAEVHDRIGAARKEVDGDPIPHVAAEIAESARLLCFDEFHVTDIADAMILGRLFRGLFDADVVVVATSNAKPDELYKNGLNRQLFLPFIKLITQHMEVRRLDSAKDFRLDKLAGHRLYFSPADDTARAEIDTLWRSLTGNAHGAPAELEVKGRKVAVPEAAMGVARFTFEDLCAKPLGSLDYLAIAHAFHTVIIENIPILEPAKRNEARRFINLIDTLYDQRVGLIASAASEPDGIYRAGDGVDLFERTASRLIEMRSEAYLEAREERGAIALAATGDDDDDASSRDSDVASVG